MSKVKSHPNWVILTLKCMDTFPFWLLRRIQEIIRIFQLNFFWPWRPPRWEPFKNLGFSSLCMFSTVGLFWWIGFSLLDAGKVITYSTYFMFTSNLTKFIFFSAASGWWWTRTQDDFRKSMMMCGMNIWFTVHELHGRLGLVFLVPNTPFHWWIFIITW